eukprot:Hpha_TRINITY_DN1091_c0_g1::TRINITY_DN1091_c0_g1_i1::g.84779::m.84779
MNFAASQTEELKKVVEEEREELRTFSRALSKSANRAPPSTPGSVVRRGEAPAVARSPHRGSDTVSLHSVGSVFHELQNERGLRPSNHGSRAVTAGTSSPPPIKLYSSSAVLKEGESVQWNVSL